MIWNKWVSGEVTETGNIMKKTRRKNLCCYLAECGSLSGAYRFYLWWSHVTRWLTGCRNSWGLGFAIFVPLCKKTHTHKHAYAHNTRTHIHTFTYSHTAPKYHLDHSGMFPPLDKASETEGKKWGGGKECEIFKRRECKSKARGTAVRGAQRERNTEHQERDRLEVNGNERNRF